MRILEPEHDDNWTLQVTCKNCETTLELIAEDIRYKDFYSGMDAWMTMDYYVKCPVCKKYVFLEKKSLPRPVQYSAESKYRG